MNHRFTLLILSLFLFTSLPGQNEPIVTEAESGTLGNDFNTLQNGNVTYVTIQTNGTQQHPENANRIITYTVTFPKAGTYNLFARVRVGASGADDDSFFYSNGFGNQTPSNAEHWILVNNIHSIGYVSDNEVVGGQGAAGNSVWKWINLSEFTGGGEPPITFTVTEGALTQTFQLGARENGLDIDKIAFGRADYYYTVENLNNGEPGSATPPMDETKKPIADGQPKFIGNVYSASQLPGFIEYWNQVTPENAGKWGSVEGTRDVMNWGQLDAAYALAKDNGFPFRFHVLVWGNQQPSWIENLPPAEQLEEIKEWFAAVANRYPEIDFIEVVNEPLHDPPNQAGSGGGNYINALGGTGSTGWDWVIGAFRLARQYFPNAKLAINDYNIVNSSSNVQLYLQIVNLLKAENLIDQIGVQAHAFSTRGSTTQITDNLNTLATAGLPLYVTELDIDGSTDAIQLADYQRLFPVFWEHPAVQGITLWGWRPGMWRTEQMAYLMEQDGVTERPALVWLREYVNSFATSINEPVNNRVVDLYPNPVIKGKITLSAQEELGIVRVLDMNGRLVKMQNASNESTVEMELNIPAGMYMVQIFSNKGLAIKKIIVQ